MIKEFIKLPDAVFNGIMLKIFRVEYLKKLKIVGKVFIKGEKNAIKIGSNVTINSNLYANPIGYSNRTTFWAFSGGKIIIGNNVGISNSAFVSKTAIEIEDNVLIGGGCKIYDTDFHQLEYKKRCVEDIAYAKSKKIKIEEGAFLGAGTIVLKGVTIGKASIIGAGSVVTKSVPPYEIWAGNPAHYVRSIEKNE